MPSPDDRSSYSLECESFSWTINETKEPYYFKDNSNVTLSTDTSIWVRYSPDFYIDFSDDRILSLKTHGESSLSGILVMVKPGETITVTGGTGATVATTFAIPNNSIILSNTEGNFCKSATPFRNATVQKTITETGTSNSIIIPAGTSSNNDHGDYRLFNYGTYGTGDSVVHTTSASNFTLRSLSSGILKTLLSTKSFITSNEILRFKFAFISTGCGHCYIRDISCDADC